MVKDKNGVEQEVEDGLKGRIIPFELVQKTLFQDDLDAIAALQSRVEAIDGELDAIREELLGMEDTDKYFDAEKDNAFVTNEIKADSKPRADVEEEVKDQLKAIVGLWDEKKAKNTQIKKAKLALEKKTIETIEGLDMKGINQFLELKWIVPITSAIEAMPDAVISTLDDAITALNEKYAVTYDEIETSISKSEQNLATLISQLTGDEYAIMGLSNLIKK
jgi:type I restriction enzyme M protein